MYISDPKPLYYMKTAEIKDGKLLFATEGDFQEAIEVGFFRIKAPDDLDLEVGRVFAKTFTSNPKYTEFGVLDVVNGYLKSEIAQTVRFTLERDNWSKCHVLGKEVEGDPNYPKEVQELGRRLHEIGMIVLKDILKKSGLPEELWFDATGGSAFFEGSHFLLFNCYDPKISDKDEGVGAHKDWGCITVLDATGPGLEAEIDGVWRSLKWEEGYLVVNFGYPIEKLLPGVKASNHRVPPQHSAMRTSTVAFIDPRMGPFQNKEGVGYVYDWDAEGKRLINPIPTTKFYQQLSNDLYGIK
jgi:hypothetical protein